MRMKRRTYYIQRRKDYWIVWFRTSKLGCRRVLVDSGRPAYRCEFKTKKAARTIAKKWQHKYRKQVISKIKVLDGVVKCKKES